MFPYNEEKDKSRSDIYIPKCQLSVVSQGSLRMEGDTGEEEDGEGEHKRKTRDQETENWPWNCWALQAPKPGRKVAVK